MACCKRYLNDTVISYEQETLQHQTDILQQQNKEAMAAFKKQVAQ